MFARMSKPGDEGVPEDDVELKLRDMEVLNENMHAENTSFLDSFRASLAYKHVDQHLITLNDACRGHTIRHVKKEYQRIKTLPDLSPTLSQGLTVISTLLSILDEIEAAVKQTPAVERAKIPLSPRSEARRIAAAANAVTPTPTSPSTPPRLSPRSTTLTITHPDGTTITEETPAATTPMTEMTSRFGNPAFRTFMDHVLSRCDIWSEMLWKYQQGDVTEMLNLITSMSPVSLACAQQTSYHQQHHAHQHSDDDQHQHQHNNESKPVDPLIQLRTEMMSYLANSFGNQRRIDYGTGHELNFLCFLLSLTRVGILPPPETRLNDDPSPSTDVAPLTLGTLQVLLVFARYMQIVRLLQHRYWLEPAGSRGVWGLDDYCFLPFVFGSAQLIGHKNIRPRSVRYSEIVDAFAQDYLYLESIQFVLSVKTCSFAEHSPMLNDITVIKTWKQVNEGLLRMYHGEVLGKFAVIQHFIFSSLLPFSSTSARPPINLHEHTGPDLTKTFTSEELNHRSIPIPHAHPHKNAAGQIEIPCCSDSVRFPSALAARQSQQ